MAINLVEVAKNKIGRFRENLDGRGKLVTGLMALSLPLVLVLVSCAPSAHTSETVVPKPTKTPETITTGELAVGQEIEAVVCPISVPSGTNIRKSPEVITPKIEGTSNLILEVPESKELVIHGARVVSHSDPDDPAGLGVWLEFVLPTGEVAYVADTNMTDVKVPPECQPPKTYTIEQLAHQGIYLIKDLTGKIEVIGGSEFRDVQSSQ